MSGPLPGQRRIAVGVEYDGAGLFGWQVQKDGPSVQAALETALSAVADEAVRVVGAGRTDTGVHSTGQVAHFDTAARRRPRAWLLGANSALPPGIALRWAGEAPDGFHARFSAVARSYSYLLLNREARPALWRDRAWWVRRRLDAERMHAAGQVLVGRHDFSALRASECQSRTPERCIHSLEVTRHGDFLRLDVTANAFLHHMVRNIVGTLAAVGRGDRPPDWVAEVLAGRDRRLAGATAPAAGLYLVHVDYGGLLPTPPAERPGPLS
ncbi:tRNA pseudouridine(38-40) synthase TruA [Wenzhouxiangella sp. XN24]|uniref:tRNA pseudouridine(38-40) synthase TruA n=1 Tax=Wenzhouxiangella sp. XN24 TaxID=2713569 RepID=UPI0013EBE3BE|nr:tRNA pseudouridine(38-40) synthase TruA [Wenzhouxiangella sp. XN24]